jgi:biotin carboxyl carrier protein
VKYLVTIEAKTYEIEILADDVIVDGDQRLSVDFQSVAGEPVYSLIVDGHSYEASVHPSDAVLEVLLQGHLFQVSVVDERQRKLRESSGQVISTTGEFQLKAPMPGLVIDVPIKSGATVSKGQNLLILESMKMQNELKAPRAGTISGIFVSAGDRVEKNQVMITLS